MSRGRALRTGVSFDQRSGFKVKGRTLVEDGERPGLWVSRSWADEASPQRFVRVPPPDGLSYRPGPPAAHAIGAKVDLTWVMQSDTHVGVTDTQQPFGVLRKTYAPFCVVDVPPDALLLPAVPEPVEPGSEEATGLQWGGFELQWGGVTMIWGT